LVFALAATIALASCGSEPPARISAPIAPGLIPASVSPGLALREYGPARKRFAAAGDVSLVDTGRLYELRDGDRLVGSLEVATLLPDVNTFGNKRKSLLQQLLNNAPYEVTTIDSVQVAAIRARNHATYVWFGDHLLEVLQIRDEQIDPNVVVGALIRHQRKNQTLQAEPENDDADWGWEDQLP
jgi:hypothetical protein